MIAQRQENPRSRSSSNLTMPGRVVVLLSLLLMVSGVHAAAAESPEVDYSPGPLSLAHEGLDDPGSCDSCHDDDLEVDGERCLVCHDRIEQRMTARKGVHGDVTSDDCAMCHSEHMGRDFDMLPFDRQSFDHAGETGFPLDGLHSQVRQCSSCHTTGSFLELSSDCQTCHTSAHGPMFDDGCTACHETTMPFESTSRAFHDAALLPLEGQHVVVPCVECHLDGIVQEHQPDATTVTGSGGRMTRTEHGWATSVRTVTTHPRGSP